MFYHLIDGDPASNFCSWQWVAGTSVNQRYTVNQSLITACSDSVQTGTFLEYERDDMAVQPVPDVLGATEPFALAPGYPAADTDVVDRPVVHLYTPWTLDPQWRHADAAQRILIIDPTFFDRYPVSADVFDFIVRQGKTVIPELQVFIGRPHELHGIGEADAVHAVAHPTNRDWLVRYDEPQWLFPEVSGYYPSFFKYWQAVTKVHSFLK
jgi:deoxyribodipyrimidine photo-lyase